MLDEDISDDQYQRNWTRRWEVLHRIQLTVLYHAKRERFFDALERAMQAIVLVAASGGVALLLASQGDKRWELWTMAVAAVVSMLQLAYAPGAKAKQHAQLTCDFKQLWSDCVAAGERWSESQCDGFLSRAIKLEAGEPPQLSALVVECENEIAVACNQSERVRRLPRVMGWLKHFWNFDISGLRRADGQAA